MNAAIGYGIVGIFFLSIVVVLELSHRRAANFADFAVAGRSFGPWFQSVAFLNTWLPGTVFVAFAGFAAGSGVIGLYLIFYSLLAILFMNYMADRVFYWGKRFDLKTQADFVGMRYASTTVRVLSAVIGVVSVFPWMVLGFQSLGLVFSYLSFGYVTPTGGVLVGIGVVGLRQVWTIRMGMRGIVISDMLQGIVAYGGGLALSIGLLTWLLSQGLGFGGLPADFARLPGFGSELGPFYFLSLVLTGCLGAWCWPDIFVRLFTAKSAATVKRSGLTAAPMLLIFCAGLLLMSMIAHHLPEVADEPDNVWFIVASHGGPVVLSLAGVCVLAATMGNVNAINAAIGTHAAQDIIHVRGANDARITKTARLTIALATALAMIGAVSTAGVTTGLVTLAAASYQGIVQLAPSLYFGIFWRRGTALGATVGMSVGFVVAAALQLCYPTSIGWLGGLTSGVVGLAVNTVLYVTLSLLRPPTAAERSRVDHLFDRDGAPRTGDASFHATPTP